MAAVFIDPRPQYTNVGATSAAVRSRFTFFESGTSDPKPIFADAGKATALNNVQLTNARGELATIYFDGVARVVREDEISGEFLQRYDEDPVEGSGSASAFQQWSSEVTYATLDIVQGSDGNLYQSLINNNLNNDPISNPDKWDKLLIRAWDPLVTYSIDDIAQGSDGFIYVSLTNNNLNNDPVTDDINWGNSSKAVEVSQSFVATGAITLGDIVSLLDDGTAERVQQLGTDAFNAAVNFGSASLDELASCYDSTNDNVVICYRDITAGQDAKAVVGKIAAGVITFGTPVTYSVASSSNIECCYDPVADRVVVFAERTAQIRALVGTISGTSISFGSETSIVSNPSSSSPPSCIFHTASGNVVLAWTTGSDGESAVGTVIGGGTNTISFASTVTFDAAASIVKPKAVFDVNSGNPVILFGETTGTLLSGIVGSVSGTVITYPTAKTSVSFTTVASQISGAYSTVDAKILCAFQESSVGTAIVAAVTGTAIAFGTPKVFAGSILDDDSSSSVAYSPIKDKFIISYSDVSNSGHATYRKARIDGTNPIFEEDFDIEANDTTSFTSVYDTTADLFVVVYADGATSGTGAAVVANVASTNADSWIGIAQNTVADTETVNVKTLGGVDGNQSGLTTNEEMYLLDDGTLNTTVVTDRRIGRAVSATEILIGSKDINETFQQTFSIRLDSARNILESVGFSSVTILTLSTVDCFFETPLDNDKYAIAASLVGAAGTALIVDSQTDGTKIQVQTSNSGGAPTDFAFSLIVSKKA